MSSLLPSRHSPKTALEASQQAKYPPTILHNLLL